MNLVNVPAKGNFSPVAGRIPDPQVPLSLYDSENRSAALQLSLDQSQHWCQQLGAHHRHGSSID